MELKEGDRIDRYTLLAPIGGGGQGTVWRVLDPLDGGVERALKLVETATLPPEAAERARREARTLAAAPHPGVIACYGLFEDVSTGLVGLVLELVDGKPLHEVASDPRMTDDHKSALLVQLAEALAHIHAMEIVHRDLKPDNVLVTERFFLSPRRPGTIKLVDFGIAVRLGNPRPLTIVGGVVGTAPYLAPEALVPSIAPEATAGYARDIFAFGILAYELFTGEHPTGLPNDVGPADLVVAYARAASAPESWPPDRLPAAWKDPIARCLSIAAADRPASGVDLLEMLLDLAPRGDAHESQRPTREVVAQPSSVEIEVVEDPPQDRPKPPPSPPARPTRSRLGPALLLLVVLALAVASFLAAPHSDAPSPIASSPAASLAGPIRSAHAAPSVCPVTCCGGHACVARPENARGCAPEAGHCRPCPSDRARVPGVCEGRIPDGGTWLLRPASVTAGGKDVIPRPKICLRKSGAGEDAWICQEGGHGHPDRHGPRLRVTTEDLTHEGIDLSVSRADKPAAIGTGVHHPAIGVAALCRGLNFRFTSADGIPFAVTLFLDDPEDGPGP